MTSPPAAGEGHEPNIAALNRRLFRSATPGDDGDELPLGPGDLIEVSVVDVSELSGRRVRVPRQGGVGLPLLGQIEVAGRSAAEVEGDIRQRLQEKYMHDPHVSVFVHERRSQRISVLGAVKKGGVIELSSRLRLADALALAEGLTDDADQVVYLFRRVPTAAIARAQAGGRAAGAPRAEQAMGTTAPGREVSATPGGQAAGGPDDAPASVAPVPPGTTAPPGAAPRAGQPEMTDIMTAIDLEAVASGNEELNVPLEAGDVIQVPRAGSFYVGGAVARPGSFSLKGRTSVHQAIVAAGGANQVAALGDVRLYRKKPDGQVEVTTLDVDEFEAGQDSPAVQKNDVIVVGRSAIKAFLWGTYDLLRGVIGVGVGF